SRLYLLANVLPHYATPFPTLRFSFLKYGQHLSPHSFPTRRSSDLIEGLRLFARTLAIQERFLPDPREKEMGGEIGQVRLEHRGISEEHTSELHAPCNLVCRLMLEKQTSELHTPCNLVCRLLIGKKN